MVNEEYRETFIRESFAPEILERRGGDDLTAAIAGLADDAVTLSVHPPDDETVIEAAGQAHERRQ